MMPVTNKKQEIKREKSKKSLEGYIYLSVARMAKSEVVSPAITTMHVPVPTLIYIYTGNRSTKLSAMYLVTSGINNCVCASGCPLRVSIRPLHHF